MPPMALKMLLSFFTLFFIVVVVVVVVVVLKVLHGVGSCKLASSVETRSLRSKLTGVSTALGMENGLLLLGVGLVAWRSRSRPAAAASGNEMEGMPPAAKGVRRG